jgi:transposase
MNEREESRLRARILKAFEETGGIRATVRRTGVSRKTVRRVLRGKPRAAPRQQPKRPSKLDAFRPVIQRLVLDDRLTAILVLEEIRQLGYAGGYSILKEYVRTVRPTPKQKVTTVIDHPPGKEGQVDWSPYTVELGGETRVVHGFSFVLPFSSYIFLRFTLDETLETLLPLHDEAFEDIEAIPPLMTYDNMTTVGRHVGPDEVWINPRFDAYRREHGNFDIHLIDPGRPNQHAPVERHFGYVENNCLKRRRSRFADLADLNAHAKWWCDTVANVRVHGTMRERPIDRLQRERPLMLPHTSRAAESFRELFRDVQKDYCVAVDTVRYSVHPRHVGQPATVREYAGRIEILVGGQVVAIHPRCFERHQRKTLPEHDEAFKKCTTSRHVLEQAFVRLGAAAEDYYAGLRTQRGRGAGYHIQRILKLADRHGTSVVLGALAHAARYGNYSADAVARVIAGREIRRPETQDSGAVPVPPERVRRWLEGLDVETGDLGDYDRIVDRLGGNTGDDTDG